MTIVIYAVWHIAGAILGAAALLAGWRAWRGPTSIDRLIGLDMLSVFLVGALAVVAQTTGQPVFLDAALAVTACAFAGTLAMAAHIAGDKRDRE